MAFGSGDVARSSSTSTIAPSSMWAIRSPKLEDAVVVGHDDDRAVGPDGGLAQKLHHGDSGLVVECRGRFVADQEPRLVDQGPRDGHSLHLPAGELAGQALQLLAHADRRQNLAGLADGPLLATSRRSPAGSPRSRPP